ncbi:hypothetical protein K437DRAFT_48246 [Tilletiaria anomala UBC 951]|uniref:Uncharacterized protein n=1 Tax=Tilletiaria anomala (strain ATCC 24038 / CBS 436.72 / UBC 951) TaxID=1037660 RepID=A0A066V540_TILAU|nr:uncharacterized protein K437DRAFT_48246 [Tilletiaria anomala UBC 951]KDN36832.1 hypothetical protein K437DRAFT_48246 [Tilletiaria anomala UBC 951]
MQAHLALLIAFLSFFRQACAQTTLSNGPTYASGAYPFPQPSQPGQVTPGGDGTSFNNVISISGELEDRKSTGRMHQASIYEFTFISFHQEHRAICFSPSLRHLPLPQPHQFSEATTQWQPTIQMRQRRRFLRTRQSPQAPHLVLHPVVVPAPAKMLPPRS